jgi:hypothetical protein
MIDPVELVERILDRYDGTVVLESWGERSVFYNPGGALPRGTYFATIKDHDGENDRASQLDRPGIYRLAIGVGARAYEHRFGTRPRRPNKGDAVDLPIDFTVVDEVQPHPVYAWMGWTQLLSPSEERWPLITELLDLGHARAAATFNKRVAAGT